MTKRCRAKLKLSHKEHKHHWGLITFAVLLIVLILVMRGEHLTWAVLGARALETLASLTLEKGLGA